MNTPTIFLDRDGTINKLNGSILSIKDIQIIEGVKDGIKLLRELNFQILVVTNQPVIARGLIDSSELDRIHDYINFKLGDGKRVIDKFYYCPHFSEHEKVEQSLKSRYVCNCRKPNIGLFMKASKDFDIDVAKSWMIGDTWRDQLFAESASLKFLKVSDEREMRMRDSNLLTFYDACARIMEIVKKEEGSSQ